MTPKNILIVEDDDAIRETLRLTLELEGYVVATASNGKEGLEVLSKMLNPCLVLLDLMMPVMDGWEFVETLESNNTSPTVPVVVVTAFAEKVRTMPRAKSVIKKPIDLEVLIETVKRYCD